MKEGFISAVTPENISAAISINEIKWDEMRQKKEKRSTETRWEICGVAQN